MMNVPQIQSSDVSLNKMADDGVRRPVSARTTLRRWVMALIAAGGLSLGSAAQAVDVKTTVNGTADTKIGELTTASGPAGDTDHFTATFKLDAAYSYLDDWYDFRWVQILASLTIGGVAQANHPLVGAIPAIDPAPSDNPAANDDGPAPFYYNGKEWKDGTFGASMEVIAKNGDFSKLSDSPQLAAGTVATFNSYLVAHDVTNNIASKSFCVLAGFSWTYTGGTAGNAGEDTSTAGAALPGGAAAAMAINTAMGNASVGGDFMGWKAEADCALFACVLGDPKWFSVPGPFTVPPGVPVTATVSTTPSSPPIELVTLTLQGTAPLILQGNDSGPGPERGTSMEYTVTTQAPITLPPETVIPGGFQVELAAAEPSSFIQVLPQPDGQPYYSSFRAGDSFFDIFVDTICHCPGGPIPQTWLVSVDLPDNVDGTFSAMSVAFSSGLTSGDAFAGGSFFDIFTEITFASGESFLPGEHIANISITSTVIPLPAPVWAGLAGLAGLAISRRRQAA